MDDLATDVANRAAKLRDGVLELLRNSLREDGSSVKREPAADPTSSSNETSSVPLLKERILQLESEMRDNEERMDEMAMARNEAVASERRVRRGLYRLASGRMNMEEVLKVRRSCLAFYLCLHVLSLASWIFSFSPAIEFFFLTYVLNDFQIFLLLFSKRLSRKKTMVYHSWKPLQ